MATVIDALVVTLGLDAKGFKKGTEETEKSLKATASASVRFAKEMEASGKQAAQVFSAIKMEALGLIGVLSGTAGLGAVAFNASKAMADLGRQAAAMNMPVDQLDAFGKAVARAGGDSATARGQLQSLADFMAESKMHGGNAEKLGYFAAIGADPWRDTPLDVMMKAADYAKTHDLLTAKTQLGKIGLGDDAMLNILKGGSAGLRSGMNESRRIGVITPEMSKNAAELQKAFVGLGQALGFAKDKWVDDWSPTATKMLDWTKEMVINNPPLVKGIGDLTLALTALGAVKVSGRLLSFLGLLRIIPQAAAILGVLELHGDTPERPPMTPEQLQDLHGGEIDYGAVSVGDLYKRYAPTWLGGHPDLAYKDGMSDAQQDFLKDLSSRESQGAYDVKNGGSKFSDYSRFPEGVGQGGESTAAGRYQFTSETWKEVSGQLGLKDFSPASQDKAAWYLAMTEYRRKTGRDLEADLREGGHSRDVNNALRGRWPSLPGASSSIPAMPSRGYSGNGKQSSLTGSNTSTVAINTINVHTAATDATGIAASIKGALANSFMAQANPGYA